MTEPVYISDLNSFAQTYEKDGQIAALTNAAEQEGWVFVDKKTSLEHPCAQIQELEDRQLKDQLGRSDPGMEWCKEEFGCVDPAISDE